MAIDVKEKNDLLDKKINATKEILSRVVYKTDILSTFISVNNGEVKNFNELAAAIINTEESGVIQNIIVAPKGVVEYIYPLSGNESVIGLDFLDDSTPSSSLTKQAVKTRKLILAGPLQAQQGGLILTGRVPLFFEKGHNRSAEFWGIVSITIKYPEIFSLVDFKEITNRGFNYKIYRKIPDSEEIQPIIEGPHNKNYKRSVQRHEQILGTYWTFTISSKSWYNYMETWLLFSISLLLSWLSTVIIKKNIKMKKLVMEINEAKEYTYLLLNTSPICVMLWDRSITLRYCNQETYKLFEINKDEEMCNIFRLITPEYQSNGEKSVDIADRAVSEALEKGTTRVVEFEHLTTKGESIPCEIIIYRVSSNEEIYVSAYIRDLRKQKAYLEEINKAREAAIYASRAKSTFLSNMSHEIRTPMNCIIGFAELARDDDVSERTHNYLTNIINASMMLLDIINDILDVSKIEAGKIELEQIHFNLSDIIKQCQQLISPKIEDKSVSLYCYVEPFIGRKLLGDPTRLRQVMVNLLSNAVKFTKSGVIKLLTSVVSMNNDSVTIHFEVKDSGIGMTSEQIKNIFEPFTQADQSISRKYGGTGLGLAITKNIIELMGGTLEVESSPHIGSRFFFDITFDTINIPIDIELKENDEDMEQPYFNCKVLVCEDNILNQQVIKEYLMRVGIDATIANNGQEGVNLVAESIENNSEFDLILMDMHMPIMDGMTATANIQKIGFKNPIIALTANILSSDMEIYKEKGMVGYLGKPFTKQDLWKCLMTYLTPEKTTTVSSNDQFYYEALQKNIKNMFMKSYQNFLVDFKEALDKKDVELAHRLVHTLKGIAGQIGEKRLQTKAAEVENKLKNKIIELKNELIIEFETEFRLVLLKLAPFLVDETKIKKKMELDKNKIDTIFFELENLLQNNDSACLDKIDEIENIEGTKELVNNIKDLSFKKAIDELNRIKNDNERKK